MNQPVCHKRKRAYDGGPCNENGEITLVGSSDARDQHYCAITGSQNQHYPQYHHQPQRRRTGPPVPHSEHQVWVHNHSQSLQDSLVPHPGLVTASSFNPDPSQWLVGDLVSYSAPLQLDAALQSPHESHPIASLPHHGISLPIESIVPLSVTAYPSTSDSIESGTIHNSYASSSWASQGGTTKSFFSMGVDFCSPCPGETAQDCSPAAALDLLADPTSSEMMDYSRLVQIPDQENQYSGVLQSAEEDMPWSQFNFSYNQSIAPTWRSHTSSWSGEAVIPPLYYPSHISSPISNASCVSSDSTPPNFAQSTTIPSLQEDTVQAGHYAFSGDQCHQDTQIQDRILPLILKSQYPHAPTSPVARFMPQNFPPANWSSPSLISELSKDTRQANQNSVLNSHIIPQGQDREIIFEHMIFSNGAIQQPESDRKTKARRCGPLPPKVKEEARKVRIIGSCWRCSLYHLPCSSNGLDCKTCHLSSSPTSRICYRARLYDHKYVALLFPEPVVARRDPSAVKQLVEENVVDYVDDGVEVCVSSGSGFPPMIMTIHEFVPLNSEFLAVYRAPPNTNKLIPSLEKVYALPFGLKENKDKNELREICSKHIEAIIEDSRTFLETASDDISPLSRDTYEAVDRYRQSKRTSGNVGLIRNVMKLYAMHFFMSQLITFSEESTEKLVESLHQPLQLPYEHSVTPKLLMHQIKQEMNSLQRELTKEVLRGLHRELKANSKASWTTSFCVILILCFCIESVQVAIDGYVVQKMMLKQNRNSDLSISRAEGFEIARYLEYELFEDSKEIFHMIYRSEKERAGFNPIRDGINVSEPDSIDEDTVQLVNDMRRIARGHSIAEKAMNPTLSNEGNLLDDHYCFRRKNSGRLIARFLKSF